MEFKGYERNMKQDYVWGHEHSTKTKTLSDD